MRPDQKKRAFLSEPSNLQLAYDFILTYIRLGRACEALKVILSIPPGRVGRGDIGFWQIEPDLQFKIVESIIKSGNLHKCFLEVSDVLLNIGRYNPYWPNMDEYQWRIVARQRAEENQASHYRFREKVSKAFREAYKQLPGWEDFDTYDDWEKTPLHREEKALLALMDIDDAKEAISQEEVFQWPTEGREVCHEWARQIYEFDQEIYDGDMLRFGIFEGDLKENYLIYLKLRWRGQLPTSELFVDKIDGDCLKRFIEDNDDFTFVEHHDSGARYVTFYSQDQGSLLRDELDAEYHYGFDDDEDEWVTYRE